MPSGVKHENQSRWEKIKRWAGFCLFVFIALLLGPPLSVIWVIYWLISRGLLSFIQLLVFILREVIYAIAIR